MQNLLKNLKAIFFDLDNVLVFSEEMHFKSWQEVVKQFGIDPNQLHFQNLIGIADSKQAQLLKTQFNVQEDANLLWELKRKSFSSLIQQGFTAPLGRNEFLSKVSQKFITGVVSSSGNHVIQEILSLEKITNFFKFVIGHEDCSKHKPDPLPYLKALEIARVEPHEALVVEDSMSGILAAQKAEIPVIGILKDQTPDQLLPNVKYFTSFNEVNHWLYG
ncbi:MAG: hypothetical protein BGO43_05330 [Gammaproteobacteria bacterium 39-13]|nr:HAD family phosphatase [Gammaproteobacteria bacterium]OJV96262.1 MAG: hypothetical protein BGO43_05330 [Gammaproteobacteria bacterium 39-13]